MKAAAIVSASWLVMFLAGCAQPPAPAQPSARRAAGAGPLELTLTVSRARLAANERFVARVTAVNRGEAPITIPAAGTSPVFLRVWRWTGYSWEQARQLPAAAGAVRKSWTLQPGQTRDFSVPVAVTPDWPTAERLRLTAELNGRPDVTDAVFLIVEPQAPASLDAR